MEREAVEFVVLYFEGEAKDLWFNHMKHARVTNYVDFTQRVVKSFDRRKLETLSIETFSDIEEKVPEEPKKYVNTITSEEEQLPPPPAAEVLTSVEGALTSLQDDPEHLKLRVPCMIQEMHEEEEADTNAGTTVEEKPSPSPTVGEAIALVGGNIVALQDVPKYQPIQGLQTFPSHIISAPHLEIREIMSSEQLHN